MPFSIFEASSFLLSFGCFLFSPSVSLKLTLAGSHEFDVLIRKSAERMKERGRETLRIPTYWFSCRLSFCSHSLSSLSFLLLWCEKAVHRQGVFVFSFSFCFFLVSLLIREQLNRWRLKGYPVEWHRWREREKEREEALSREIEKGFSMRATSDLIQSSTLFSPLKSFHQACAQVPSPLRPQISPGLLSQMKR